MERQELVSASVAQELAALEVSEREVTEYDLTEKKSIQQWFHALSLKFSEHEKALLEKWEVEVQRKRKLFEESKARLRALAQRETERGESSKDQKLEMLKSSSFVCPPKALPSSSSSGSSSSSSSPLFPVLWEWQKKDMTERIYWKSREKDFKGVLEALAKVTESNFLLHAPDCAHVSVDAKKGEVTVQLQNWKGEVVEACREDLTVTLADCYGDSSRVKVDTFPDPKDHRNWRISFKVLGKGNDRGCDKEGDKEGDKKKKGEKERESERTEELEKKEKFPLLQPSRFSKHLELVVKWKQKAMVSVPVKWDMSVNQVAVPFVMLGADIEIEGFALYDTYVFALTKKEVGIYQMTARRFCDWYGCLMWRGNFDLVQDLSEKNATATASWAACRLQVSNDGNILCVQSSSERLDGYNSRKGGLVFQSPKLPKSSICRCTGKLLFLAHNKQIQWSLIPKLSCTLVPGWMFSSCVVVDSEIIDFAVEGNRLYILKKQGVEVYEEKNLVWTQKYVSGCACSERIFVYQGCVYLVNKTGIWMLDPSSSSIPPLVRLAPLSDPDFFAFSEERFACLSKIFPSIEYCLSFFP